VIRDKKKTTIEELESGLISFVEKTTLTPRANIKMDDIDANVIALKRREKDAIIEKKFVIKFSDFLKVNTLLGAMDSLNCSFVKVIRISHSKIEEYKREVRIMAMKNAQEKAGYLLEAVNSKVGKPIKVAEKDPSVALEAEFGETMRRAPALFSTVYSKRTSDSGGWDYENLNDSSSGTTQFISSTTVELIYSIDVTFEIL
jgi:Protein of unknown function (DUF541)